MISDPTMTDPELILCRTHAGSREAVMEAVNLSDAERRLLLIVNGLTPLADLLMRLHESNATQVVHKLLDQGLITDAYEVAQARLTFPAEA